MSGEVHTETDLKTKWLALKRVLSGDNECLGTDEWKDLNEEILGEKEPALIDPDLPLAIPGVFPGDGQNVRKAEIVKSYHNKRLWGANILSATGRPGDTVNLWVRADTLVKIGWTVYVKPNANPSEEGYVLQGEYNKFGDRLR